jgi:type III restriction enzyme
MGEQKKLYELLTSFLGQRSIDATEIPASISGNVNPNLPLRSYQKSAFKLFINYWNESFEGKPKSHQLLFHMATGSGKTLMMAGLILYLYEQGYRNFLFFVNNNNIIEKTKDNFLNRFSKKYLFNQTITYSDRKVEVREVSSFQAGNPDCINIVFTTIQGLHMDLNTPRENSLTYDDFDSQKIVLISDEAHHINAETKKGKFSDQQELLESISWEGTVEKIFNANPSNVLLEFSATVDFSNQNINDKYSQRLLFDYPLKEFRKDGYSKEVKVIQTHLPAFERALQAVLISQYRRKIFEKNKKLIKPVILFKSKQIKESQAFYKEFISRIKNLQPTDLIAFKEYDGEPTLVKFFRYLDENNISIENLISELQEDFSEQKLIEVNSKEESEAKQIAVNSLEENEYRAVFAVDKLNEGWDVLNLFDIVRLYDTRDSSKDDRVGKTTMTEAQLIGRGARYCPFQVTPDQSFFCRKYDHDIENELRICEVLFYHSAYNPRYIQELNQALQVIGIKPKMTIERKIRIKDSFKETLLYKTGHIFINERLINSREEINALNVKALNSHSVSLYTGFSKGQEIFAEDTNFSDEIHRSAKDYNLIDFGLPVIRKAIQRLPFFQFSNLKIFLPNLISINDFITSENYLGRVKVEVKGTKERIENLTQDDKLSVSVQVLDSIASVIASDKVDFKGSKIFKPKMLNAVFTDKTLNFSLDDSSEREYGKSMMGSDTAYYLDLKNRDWFVFDDCFGTSEEKLLIYYIDKKYDELAKKYDGVYLLRNEKHFQLYAFDDGSPFEPDFLLYLVGKEKIDTKHYQIFVEPKGGHLRKLDQWKEDFLLAIKGHASIEQLFSNKHYVVWGLPFFTEEYKQIFDSAFTENLIS